MAEIGLIASIFSVAAFGTSVATTLYQTADVMINADQQIYALAKHVSQSTAVLKHMGEVLETEKANCSKELLRDIRKIKHSCKRTFKEIKATTKPKRFRLLGSVRWLFKRTKAMELEARLDSQQSMLQCIIHTLSVSRLGRMDSRSKQDSEHIIGLKVEINLLKTFIMESYNSLGELKRAEQSTDAEEQYQSTSRGNTYPATHHLRDASSVLYPDPVDGSNRHEPRIGRSSSPASRASDSENEDINLGSETDDSEDNDDDADDADDNSYSRANNDSHKSKNQNDHDHSNIMSNRFSEEELVSKVSLQPQSSLSNGMSYTRRRESDFLLQMVPYRPRPLRQINSDRLIPYKQDPDDDTKDLSQGATNSVRLLLDKWTNSGSAPVSEILTEEATKEKNEIELAKGRRTSDPQFDPYGQWPLPKPKSKENYNGPSHYPTYEDYPDSGGFHMPPPPPGENRYPLYGYSHYEGDVPPRQDFWRSPHSGWGPQNRTLGVEILHGLRSARGGIYYTKSNPFKQVHYVDRHIIYICQLVPPRFIPSDELNCLNTEVDKGLVRGEALDLLGYSYIETDAGKLSISGDLELSEIEELVHLSYQGLDRQLKTRSKTVIEKRGWITAVHDMNQAHYLNEPDVLPGYHSPVPPKFLDHRRPLYGQIPARSSSFTGEAHPGRSASSEVHRSDLQPSTHSFVERHAVPVVKNVELEEQAQPKAARPEVRFTLPNANLTSTIPNAPKGAAAQPSSAKPNMSPTKQDDEYLKLCQKRNHLQEKKEAASKAGDFGMVADIMYYALPDLEKEIEKMKEKQREEKDKKQQAAAKAAQIKKDRSRKYHTEVETESEHDEDEGDLKEQDIYD